MKGRIESYAPGDLLVIDASGERRLSKLPTPYSPLVAGIYSTQSGVVGSQHRLGEPPPSNEVSLAVVGIVPRKTVIDTHWHFDHTDNNANLHAAGATVLAHENTKTRSSSVGPGLCLRSTENHYVG